jgi:hypothetical protein
VGEKGTAFVKGGCGCLVVFAVLALIAVVVGGSVQIDIGGAVLLFVIGGLIGLVVLWIYNKGRYRDAQARGFEVQTRNSDDKDRP